MEGGVNRRRWGGGPRPPISTISTILPPGRESRWQEQPGDVSAKLALDNAGEAHIMLIIMDNYLPQRRGNQDLQRRRRGQEVTVIFNSAAPAPAQLPLQRLLDDFLTDLENAGRSRHTIVNYRCDLRRLIEFAPEGLAALQPSRLRLYFSSLAGKAAPTRARAQASANAFLTWCYRHDLIPANPMQKLDRVKLPEYYPRPLESRVIRKALDAIPRQSLRDRLLFTLIAETGLRVSEALGIYHEDLILTPDDEQIIVRGKGGRTRTVMLYAAPESLQLLRRYLRESRIASGALFRGDPARGGSSRPIHYRTAHHAWLRYCQKARVEANIHALRHSFATRLLNEGIGLAVVRKLLGHRNMQSTLRYAEVTDATIKRELLTRHRRPL
ncbi:MAG TPA: tyrosine-type recombinase/integrase [Planctomycetota bacterium]|nr:tyrosine-type recombinase/integrase [Planctomycetota bacterium]